VEYIRLSLIQSVMGRLEMIIRKSGHLTNGSKTNDVSPILKSLGIKGFFPSSKSESLGSAMDHQLNCLCSLANHSGNYLFLSSILHVSNVQSQFCLHFTLVVKKKVENFYPFQNDLKGLTPFHQNKRRTIGFGRSKNFKVVQKLG